MKPVGLLDPIAPARNPFQQVGVDLLGPFPKSSAGKRWIAVATDYITRYAQTTSLASGTAAEVAEFIAHHSVLLHGCPAVIIPDRGAALTARLTQAVLKLTHTSHRRTTAYHRQTKGLVERLNRTHADMLSMHVYVEHKAWDQILPYATFAHNTVLHETKRLSTFQLVFGRPVNAPLAAMLPVEPDCESEPDPDVATFAQRVEAAHELARQRIHCQQQIDADRYNLARRFVTYEPGDYVWVWTPVRRRGHSEKLLRRYFGAFFH